jgi:hypothetical protein
MQNMLTILFTSIRRRRSQLRIVEHVPAPQPRMRWY